MLSTLLMCFRVGKETFECKTIFQILYIFVASARRDLQPNTKMKKSKHEENEEANESKDAWATQGSFICRNHQSSRNCSCARKEENFPIPLKYIEVMRQVKTSIGTVAECTISDQWTRDGQSSLRQLGWIYKMSDPQTKVTRRIQMGPWPTHHQKVQPTRLHMARNLSYNPEAEVKGRDRQVPRGERKITVARAQREDSEVDLEDKDYRRIISQARSKCCLNPLCRLWAPKNLLLNFSGEKQGRLRDDHDADKGFASVFDCGMVYKPTPTKKEQIGV